MRFSKAVVKYRIPILILTLLLTVVGLIMLFSASFPRAYYDTGDGTYYFKRQALFAAVGMAAMFVIAKINYQRWRGASRMLVGLALFLLILVIIPHNPLAITANRATRWLGIRGVFQFQPSEIAKLAVIVYFSDTISKKREKMLTWRQGILPYVALLGVISVLMMLEPHLSGTVLILCTGAVLMIVGGIQAWLVAVGIGGVGGYTVEALARSGVGALDLIDDDKVCLTNLNRQIVATRKTVGQYKVDVAEQRIHEIDPNIKVTTYKTFFTPETQDQFDFTQYDYVVDAIDTVTGKIALVVKAKEAGTPIICAMGAGNKMDPTRFEVTDIYKTSVCPLAKVMRTECRKRKIKHLKVVYSKEPAMTPIEDDSISCKNHCICPPGTQRKCTIRRSVPGSNAFVPSVAGLIIGGEVVKDLVGFVPLKG